jgi:hypothetical protein
MEAIAEGEFSPALDQNHPEEECKRIFFDPSKIRSQLRVEDRTEVT